MKREVEIVEVGNGVMRLTSQRRAKTLLCAEAFVNDNKTIRETASELGYSKTSVHICLRYFAPVVCGKRLNTKVQKLLDRNKQERAIRGGMATKAKLEAIKAGM